MKLKRPKTPHPAQRLTEAEIIATPLTKSHFPRLNDRRCALIERQHLCRIGQRPADFQPLQELDELVALDEWTSRWMQLHHPLDWGALDELGTYLEKRRQEDLEHRGHPDDNAD